MMMRLVLAYGLACLVVLCAAGGVRAQQPLSGTLTYQGRLDSNGTPFTGVADFIVSLHDAATAGNQPGNTIFYTGVPLTAGAFTLPLEFEPRFMNGDRRWIRIGVRTDPFGSYTILEPRQEITATYAARFALDVPAELKPWRNSGPNLLRPSGSVGIGVPPGSRSLHLGPTGVLPPALAFSPRGPNPTAFPTAFDSGFWSEIGNLGAADGSYAFASVSGFGFPDPPFIAKGYNLAIPSNATITGVQVIMVKVLFGGSGTLLVRDFAVQLVGGPAISQNRANPSVWSFPAFSTIYGGQFDTWGVAWTPAMINSPDFGVHFQVYNPAGSGGFASVGVDYVQVTVFYTTPQSNEWAVGFASDSSGDLTVATDAAMTNRVLTMKPSGSVGIGTSLPTAGFRMEVLGNLRVAGNIVATGTITPSSAALKDGIVPIEDALGLLESIRGVRFSWNKNVAGDASGQADLGFVAEEVRRIFPELVPTNPATGEMLGVKYTGLIPVTVEAIHELDARVKAQEARIAALTAQIEQLQKALEATKAGAAGTGER